MDNNPLPTPVSPPDAPDENSTAPAAGSVPAIAEARGNEVRRESVWAPLREIFVGPEGLYPAARWLIYIAMCFFVFGVLSSVLHAVSPVRGGMWSSFTRELVMMLSAILPGFALAPVEGRRFGDFGLPTRGVFGRNFWAGALWGIGALTVLMLVLRAAGAFTFGSLDLHGARIVKFGFFYLVFFLMTGLFEDFLMRGYSQWVLTRAMNFWPAAAFLSIIFGALHTSNAGETKVGLVAVVFIGFFFCLTLRRTGTLWWAVGFHMAWDWGESFLYSVPDSGTLVQGHLLNSSFQGPDWLTGGSVGPEGSYLIFGMMAGLWVLFSWLYPEVKYGVGEIPVTK